MHFFKAHPLGRQSSTQRDKVGNYVSLSTHRMNKWPKSLECVHPGLPEEVGRGRTAWGPAHQGLLAFKGTYTEPVAERGTEPLFCQ